MVWEILATAPFGKEKKGEVGVERLVDEGAYSAAFPLHDVSHQHLISLMSSRTPSLSSMSAVSICLVLMIFALCFDGLSTYVLVLMI